MQLLPWKAEVLLQNISQVTRVLELPDESVPVLIRFLERVKAGETVDLPKKYYRLSTLDFY